ncbi:MAG: hypothetical protein IJ545_07085 [Alphaproteobacteria bacterium]|nr:hypothetical protein [Alphaproteobacteria bacterium]
MAQNQSAGNGALFKNDKQGVEARPDYTGTAKIWDKDFFISCWLKTSQTGKRYMSLAFKVNDKQGAAQSQASVVNSTAPASTSAPVDDDIPF